MSVLTIEVDAEPVLAALEALRDRATDLSPALKEIGEDLVDSTLQRFAASEGPDGTPWAPNSETTILRYLDAGSGVYSKKRTATGGRTLTKRGMTALVGKKPLIGETKNLSSTITYQVVDGGTTLLVGSPEKYAATQQFGAKQGEYGRTRGGSPIPWGDIPARPFLGLSADDESAVVDVIRRHLERAAGG